MALKWTYRLNGPRGVQGQKIPFDRRARTSSHTRPDAGGARRRIRRSVRKRDILDIGNKGSPTASQATLRVHCQGQKDGESMSGTRDQEKNGIPELTVSVPVLPETVAGESLQYSP